MWIRSKRYGNAAPVGSSGGGGSGTIKSQGFITDGVETEFEVTNGVIGTIISVFFNTTFADPDTYSIAGNIIDFGVAPVISPDGTENLWIVYAE